MSIHDKIRSTASYSRLDNFHQKLILNKKNTMDIALGVNMGGLTSFENWVQKTSPREVVKNIVR